MNDLYYNGNNNNIYNGNNKNLRLLQTSVETFHIFKAQIYRENLTHCPNLFLLNRIVSKISIQAVVIMNQKMLLNKAFGLSCRQKLQDKNSL